VQTSVGEKLDFATNVQVEELVSLLEISSGGTLVICVCNPPVLRKKVLGYLRKRLSGFNVGIYDVDVAEKDEHIVKLLKGIEESGRFRRFEKKLRSVVLSVMGIENVVKGDRLRISRFYQNLNLYRDFFIQTKHPVLFWVNEAVASELGVRAPDFWRARTKVADFIQREEMMIQSLEQLAGMPVFYKNLADIRRRERIHERLLKLLDPDNAKDRHSYATIALSLGFLKYIQGNHDGAYRLYEQSLKIKRELGDKSGISASMHQLAIIEQDRGNYDKARELYEQSLKIHRELGDKSGIAVSMNAFGTLFEKQERFEDALRHFLQAAYLFHQLGFPMEKQSLNNLARTAKKIRKKRRDKILEETPDEIKAYLIQITQKTQIDHKTKDKTTITKGDKNPTKPTS